MIIASPASAYKIDSVLNQPVFEKLTNDDGLSQGTINDIMQDKKGFMWFATKEGLNRYDGYDIKVYKNILGESTSLSSNNILKVLEDHNEMIWVGTDQGIDLFDPKSEIFSRVNFPDSIGTFHTCDMCIDKNDNLWIGTAGKGLLAYNITTGKTKVFKRFQKDTSSPGSNIVKSVFADSKNQIWFSTVDGGLNLLEEVSGKIRHFVINNESWEKSGETIISSFMEDQDGNLWLGTLGETLIFFNTKNHRCTFFDKTAPHNKTRLNTVLDIAGQGRDTIWIASDSEGLLCMNIKSGTLTPYSHGPSENNILYQTIKSLYVDRDKNLWIGTHGKGINILSPYPKMFFSITNSEGSGINLGFESVRAIYEDADNIVWVGGYGGLQRIDLINGTSSLVIPGAIYSICQHKTDPSILWIGFEGQGISSFNKNSHKLRRITLQVNTTPKLKDPIQKPIRAIYEIMYGPDDMLYLGSNKGLVVLDPKTENYELFQHDPMDDNSIPGNKILSLLFDSENTLWVGTITKGLSVYNSRNKTFSKRVLKSNNGTAANHRINSIYEDSNGNIWIGTNLGLHLLDEANFESRLYTEDDGLANNVIYGILEDRDKNIWVSTNQGISKINTSHSTIQNFDNHDGLPCNEFNTAAYFQYNKERLYFGGVSGLVIFNPEQININPIPPKVIFTRMQIYTNEQSMEISPIYLPEIALHPNERMIMLEFSAMNFIDPKDCKYQYNFSNLGDEWINLGNNRSLTLTYLDPGLHEINIRAANNDGIWNTNAASIKLLVEPKFHETIWFRISVVAAFLFLFVLIYTIRVMIIKQQNKKLETLVDLKTGELQSTNLELKTANATKDKFFSIIAHDLKNPFNSILGFLEILETDWAEIDNNERKEIIRILKQTSENTYRLLLNLLEWSRVQKKSIEYNPVNLFLDEITNNAIQYLEADFTLKNIKISNHIPTGLKVHSDSNLTLTILRNILTNAIKFTPKNGEIKLFTDIEDNYVKCCIEDNGIGMTEETIKTIFDYTKNISRPGTDGEPGTGLGMILTKEFITLNGGNIWVTSNLGYGTKFCFTLPKDSNIKSPV